ncbi:MAG: polysulfide reductase [Gemmatimonadetes bacterium]|nr:MAG: polysulfide reductase [Gemmatimonadota bacterium]
MSSTFFTASPQWRWLIVAYFFLGGLAAGSYVLATLMDLFGKSRDRRLVHLGYLIAFPLVGLCGLVLTVDLGRPERFWHMLIQSETLRPMIKTYSPMSLGAWALLCFGGCALLSFVAVLAERGWLGWPLLRRLSPPAFVGRLVTVVGALLGFYVAGYTGVLLSVTNRPIWADTTLLGLTFLISAASTSAALLILLGFWGGASGDSIDALEHFDAFILVLEAIAIAGLLVSLGRIAMVWLNGWGLLLAVMVLGGIALPLYMRLRAPGPRRAIGPVLVLLGGLILRAVIIFSSDRLS